MCISLKYITQVLFIVLFADPNFRPRVTFVNFFPTACKMSVSSPLAREDEEPLANINQT